MKYTRASENNSTARGIGDPHALFVKALYAHAAGDGEGYRTYGDRLRASSAAAAAALDRATADVVLAWSGCDSSAGR